MAVWRLHKASTPYNATQLSDLGYAQAFTTAYLTHLDFAPGKIVREAADDWVFSYLSFGPTQAAPTSVTATATVDNDDTENASTDAWAYFPQEYSYIVTAVSATGQESVASTADTATNDLSLKRNYTTITWTAAASADYYRIYKAHESGIHGYIGETDGLTFTDDNIQGDLSDAPPIASDPFDSTDNYPAVCAFFEQRLLFGRTNNVPSGIWGSRSADFENLNYARPLQESDGLSFSIATGELNQIEALLPMTHLLALTSDNIMSIRGANDDYIAAVPPPIPRVQVAEGIGEPDPIRIKSVAFYQARDDDGIRTLGYSFELNGDESRDISIFAPHLFKNNRVVEWSYAQTPDSVIWCVMEDGTGLCFTWQAEQQIWGWTRFVTDGTLKDVCSITESGESRTYFLIERTINSVDTLFVERMTSSRWTDFTDACYLDCAKTFYYSSATNVIDKLEHLEGETVKVLADGFVHDATVSGGQVDIGADNAATTVHVGLPYDTIVETLPLPEEWQKKATGPLFLDLVDSLAVKGGRQSTALEEMVTRETEALDTPTPPFTGTVRINIPQKNDREGGVIIKQTEPLPMTLTGIYWKVG